MIAVPVLNRHLNLLFKPHGIGQMKNIRRLIPTRIPLVNRRPIHQKRIILHPPRLIEIIFATSTVQLRRPLVPIHPDHIIALAPPCSLKIRHRQIAPNIMPDPCRLQNHVITIPRLPLNIDNIRLWRIDANFMPPGHRRDFLCEIARENTLYLLPRGRRITRNPHKKYCR